ncbi:exosome complex protein LRP1 [Metschnikowia aff. pulcherrima]|uniref:Exosome complex protein n=1 Tax=Metschnikowia aff. pulcherrima TaxID=2163413 RepID=A0A4P6XIA1_9ASCO|nr:exosome complex protein LRP1 [Metschnikowia aff. pulcherrima]
MENLEDISAFVKSLNGSIDNLNEALGPALSQSLEDHISKCLLPQEKVKLYHSHLYTVISVLFAYIKVMGIKTDSHPIMKELTRIKGSMKAMKDIEESKAKNAEDSKKSTNAANEFLQRTLGTNGGSAAPESLKSPAISSANFQGKHTRFTDEARDEINSLSKDRKKASSYKITKPRKQKK